MRAGLRQAPVVHSNNASSLTTQVPRRWAPSNPSMKRPGLPGESMRNPAKCTAKSQSTNSKLTNCNPQQIPQTSIPWSPRSRTLQHGPQSPQVQLVLLVIPRHRREPLPLGMKRGPWTARSDPKGQGPKSSSRSSAWFSVKSGHSQLVRSFRFQASPVSSVSPPKTLTCQSPQGLPTSRVGQPETRALPPPRLHATPPIAPGRIP